MPEQVSSLIRPYLVQDFREFPDRVRTAYSMAGIPEWSYNVSLTKMRVRKDLKLVLSQYMESIHDNIAQGKHCIIYSANEGAGTSSLLFTLAKIAIEHWFSGMCFYYPDLLALFRRCLVEDKFKMEFKRSVQQMDFIAVDDFGAGHVVNNSYAISEFSDLLYYMESGLYHPVTLLVSSKIDFNECSKYMTNSAFSRLQAVGTVIELIGSDIRMMGEGQ